MGAPLLQVENLKMKFPVKSEKGEKKFVKAVDGVSFEILEGETLGLVGESGCGKTTIGKMIVKLLKPTEGRIIYRGKDITHLNNKEFRPMRKQIQMIFQDPYSSLDPRQQIGKIIQEGLVVNNYRENAKEKVLACMDDVGLSGEFYKRYPHEFSGGQRQRIGVARALALNPALIVCDEPVSALDVSIQAQILNLMNKLQKKYNLTYLFVSHDLRVVKHLCDRVAVMYLGRLVELASRKDIFNNPLHPYTKGLLAAVPIVNPEIKQEQGRLKGDMPSPINMPKGCRFHTRCESCMNICREESPEVKEISPGHKVECHLYR